MNATAFGQKLKRRGIETRPFFLGLHEQPIFHRRGLFLHERYPIAERIARQGLYLPSGLALYWLTTNIVSIIQQAIMNRLNPPEITTRAIRTTGARGR